MLKFDLLDYAVIVGYLLSVLVLGLYFSRRQNSLREYFHASGTVPWWAVGISIVATGLSPISYLAGPGWIFVKDSRNSLVSCLLGMALVPLTAAVWIPLWSRLRVLSIYEYLELRFHPLMRLLGAFLFLMLTTIWVGTALSTAGLGFEKVTGFSAIGCIIAIAVLGTAYTMLGGLRAVIWTDVAQFVVFMVGYGAILVVLLKMFHWQPLEIYRIASETISTETGHPHTRLISFEWSTTVEATFWVLLFSRVMVAISCGADQREVQRWHASGSRRAMVKSIFSSFVWLLLFLMISLPASWGFVAFYAQQPELKATIQNVPDQVLPDFVVRNLPHVFRSLIMAGVLAALMSSFDSALNSMSSVTVNDVVRRHLAPRASERRLVFIAKALTAVFGIVVIGFALWQLRQQDQTAQEKMTKLLNVFVAPIPSFFLLGILSKRTNTPGVLIGAIAGIAFAIVFNGIPGILEKQVEWFNWMWITGLATIVNVVIGYLASYLFAPPSPEKLEKVFQN
ncbi:MAG: hypothetical protein CMJ45_02895 [Planctomyces sp.]|nr:hypothetical protein [Planctomycetaceae bacterium]MBQ10478.1 hypothetical protein [Planctomyces sp.]